MKTCLNNSFDKLEKYVIKNNYEGYDLFDGLNSKIFKNSFLYKNRFFRLALIQFCKLSLINFRKLLLIPKSFNPKGGALFLLGNLNRFEQTKDLKYKNEAEKLYQKLKKSVIKRKKGLAWGYNFDWQARAFYVPTGTPNVVTSVFVGKSFLKYHEIFNDEDSLKLAEEIADFIENEMILFETDEKLCFSYIPNQNAEVHNANLLAASYLAIIDKEKYKEKIEKALNFSLSDINEDFSWAYGTKPFHRWVDNFHTAFNIESLMIIDSKLEISGLSAKIENIIEYYLNNLFTNDGIPKYYNNSTYPTDIHVIAETLIVIEKIKKSKYNYDKNIICKIEIALEKLIEIFQNKNGYFYYQKNKYYMNKIPYIRWGQAWMFYGLSQCF